MGKLHGVGFRAWGFGWANVEAPPVMENQKEKNMEITWKLAFDRNTYIHMCTRFIAILINTMILDSYSGSRASGRGGF